MVPLIGALAYIVVELIPEWFGSPGAQQARRRVAAKLDPEKRYRGIVRSAARCRHHCKPRRACRRMPRARALRRSGASLRPHPVASDGRRSNLRAGQGEGQFGAKRPSDAVTTLDALKAKWPDFESGEGHLLYARALAEAGRVDEALEEYSSVITYFSGAEARVRYGLLLKLVGRTAEARVIFNELLLQMRRAPKHAQSMQAEWLAIAEKQLSA
ncbi:hypothetical protein [Bradyrhizobium lablabi]|uniref:hypothetical protein n=1 Tax=Bradyrhizobium lablabi TaxID=722472 RepID=UPI002010E2DB|nr:hypothetical protein [Bradyrhizobium lablabi]